ncbi:hypothetical protein NL676_021248 [Syzygium grande]|nr:hypothetical protein NL676_021248 [Syzygium grande]
MAKTSKSNKDGMFFIRFWVAALWYFLRPTRGDRAALDRQISSRRTPIGAGNPPPSAPPAIAGDRLPPLAAAAARVTGSEKDG